jgi:hypothetical protein
MIQGLISKVARMIEVKILNELKASCDLLIITHHIKDKYVENMIAGKVPESSATFSEVCNMRMWLRRNQISKVPVILFLKRPNLPKLVSGQLRFVNIVPLKITPTDKHQSIWDAIAEYEANPIESRQPTEAETPNPEELAAINNTLSPEQQSYVKAMIEYQKAMAKELEEIDLEASGASQEQPGRIENKQDDTFPVNGIQLISRAKSELGFALEDVQRVLQKNFAQINESYKSDYWLKLLEEHNGTIANMVAGKEQPKKKAKK